MSEQWIQEINQVLCENGVPADHRLSLVVLYHRNETMCGQRLEAFCRLFTQQLIHAYPDSSEEIEWRGFCLPGVQEKDILPYLAQAHILLLVISVDCLLELHQLSQLSTALTKPPLDRAYRIGIMARSAPLEHEPICLEAQFPTDEPSLAHCSEDDEIYTRAMKQIWDWAQRKLEQL